MRQCDTDEMQSCINCSMNFTTPSAPPAMKCMSGATLGRANFDRPPWTGMYCKNFSACRWLKISQLSREYTVNVGVFKCTSGQIRFARLLKIPVELCRCQLQVLKTAITVTDGHTVYTVVISILHTGFPGKCDWEHFAIIYDSSPHSM